MTDNPSSSAGAHSAPVPSKSRRKTVKFLVSIAVSAGLIAWLIHKLDLEAIRKAFAHVHGGWFAVAMLLFIPQIVAIAARWRMIAEPLAKISLAEAIRQILVSNCLNIALPSKLGDLTKGVFLYRQGRCKLDDGLHIVVFEKLMDLASLSAWMLVGWCLSRRYEAWVLSMLGVAGAIVAAVLFLYFTPWGARLMLAMIPPSLRRVKKMARIVELLESGPGVMELVHADGKRRAAIVASSFGIWLLHLMQIACFFWSVNAMISVFDVVARMPVSILAGLLPLGFAGVGPREAVILAMFETPTISREVLIAASVLIFLRYVVPAVLGLPLIPRYFGMTKEVAKG